MGCKIVIVDAFTSRPFSGNPAAVCMLSEPREDRWMQDLAREMNLPATSFLSPEDDGSLNLRWFTTKTELELCGHGTLASAHALSLDGLLEEGHEVRFKTKSGLLTARLAADWIEVDFPSEKQKPTLLPPDLLRALGILTVRYVGKNRFDYLLEVDSEETLRKIRPRFRITQDGAHQRSDRNQ